MMLPGVMMVFTLLLGMVTQAGAAQETALDRYVAVPDAAYHWEQLGWDKGGALQPYKTYFLKLTSQEWRSAEEVDRPLWEHELIITVPDRSPRGTVLLLVDGGNNTSSPISKGEDAIGMIAYALRMAVAVVRQVPNQPLHFADEYNLPRKEDEILAYSMDKFLQTGDETWPVHLAMTKSVVRAMDAVQEYMAEHRGIKVEDFIVTGGSKRGWTTWLTAAVDPRVKAIMPISADLLNLKNQFSHHWGAYGFYAPAVGDYEDFDLSCRLRTGDGEQLSRIIDPYHYRDRYTMPKLLINSVGDEFFVTDSARLYYESLPDPKSLRNTFNTDHRQGGEANLSNLLRAAMLWVDDVNGDKTSPYFSWSLEEDGAIRVRTSEGRQPQDVFLWQAVNPVERDFRLEEIGPAWSATRLVREEDGSFLGRVEVPESGFVAYSVELRYDERDFAGLFNLTQVYTTEARILPDVLPYTASECLASTPGNLENPSIHSGQSGIGVISGWACDAQGVEIEVNGSRYLPAAYGTLRKDTQASCNDVDNGFGLLYNFNLLGNGPHSIRALTNGRVIDQAEFEVTTLGEAFRRDLQGEYRLPGFPSQDQEVRLAWEESLQGFAIAGFGPLGQSLPTAVEPLAPLLPLLGAAPLGRLENPANGSHQSGVSVISGWICDAEEVRVEINGNRSLQVAYGTPRADTQAVCGGPNNGFGLLYNLNLLGPGEHEIRLIADGRELDRARFRVTTLGESFLRGATGEFRVEDFPQQGQSIDVRWNESRQNFLIDGMMGQ